MSSITVSRLKNTRYFSESKLQSFNAKDQLFECPRRISFAFSQKRGTVPRTMAVVESLKLPSAATKSLSEVPLIEIEVGYWQRAGMLRASRVETRAGETARVTRLHLKTDVHLKARPGDDHSQPGPKCSRAPRA